MAHPALRGRSILVVENELLIAMDIAQALESAGRERHDDDHVRHAPILIEQDGLAGPIMDHGLTGADSTQVCARLKERGIPYLRLQRIRPSSGREPGRTAYIQACQHGRVDERSGGAPSG